MKLYCYNCDERVMPGDGIRVEGKLLHKECAVKLYKWYGEMHKGSVM